MNTYIAATEIQNQNRPQPCPADTQAHTLSQQQHHPQQYTYPVQNPESAQPSTDPTTCFSQFLCWTMEDTLMAQHMLPLSSRPLCFVDASTHPDNGLSHLRGAGLGIYIVNLQVQPSNFIYIRASLHETHSVIYAEAAALVLATVVLHRLGLHHVDFHSDSLQLVNLLNSNEPRMAPIIKIFQDYTRYRNTNVLKIDRQFNCIAYYLACLAFSSSQLQYPTYVPSCSYEHRDHQCPLLAALSTPWFFKGSCSFLLLN
jgi:hypothetical protein